MNFSRTEIGNINTQSSSGEQPFSIMYFLIGSSGIDATISFRVSILIEEAELAFAQVEVVAQSNIVFIINYQ